MLVGWVGYADLWCSSRKRWTQCWRRWVGILQKTIALDSLLRMFSEILIWRSGSSVAKSRKKTSRASSRQRGTERVLSTSRTSSRIEALALDAMRFSVCVRGGSVGMSTLTGGMDEFNVAVEGIGRGPSCEDVLRRFSGDTGTGSVKITFEVGGVESNTCTCAGVFTGN